MSMPSRFRASPAARPIRFAAGVLLVAALVPGLSDARPGQARAGAQAVRAACLSVSADTLDFGPVAVGERKTLEMSLHNSCRQTITVTSLAVSSEAFGTSAATPFPIPGLGSRPLPLAFAPTDTGELAGELRIRIRDSRRDFRVALRGEGVSAWLRAGTLEVSPSRIDETLPSRHAVGRVLTLRNVGEDTLRVNFESVVAPPGTGLETRLSLLYLLPFEGEFYENNFVWLMQGLRRVSNVAIRSGFSQPPSLEELRAYDIVLVNGGAWADPESTGNALADYVDAGGRLILMNPALSTSSGLGGRIVGPEYSPVPKTAAAGTGFGIGTSRFIDHPLVEGVSGFRTLSYLPVMAVQGAGRPLAYYQEGSIAAAYNAERPVAFVNVNPHDGDYQGYYSIQRLFSNLIDQYYGTRNWLHVPAPIYEKYVSLAPGETQQLVLPVGHVWGLPAGLHQGVINLYFEQPEILRIPATLTVTAP